MDIFESAKQINGACAVALGTFDGLHIGHMRLIRDVSDYAKASNILSCVFTFSQMKEKHITDNNSRIKILQNSDIDILIMENFTDAFKNLSPYEFLSEYIVDKLNAKMITVGFNYRYGKDALGDIYTLKEFCEEKNIKLNIIKPILWNNDVVSSTRIKNCIQNGDIEAANEMLGRNFSISHTVCHGDKIGRTIDFPTANIKIEKSQIVPADGVYATVTKIGNKSFYSITNCGGKPTVKENSYSIETHILNFDDEIYDNEIEITFYKRLRSISKFNSLEHLKKQLEADKTNALNFFSENGLQI